MKGDGWNEKDERNKWNEMDVDAQAKEGTTGGGVEETAESTNWVENKYIENQLNQEILSNTSEKKNENEKAELCTSGESVDDCFNTLNVSIENLNSHVNAILKDHEKKYLLVFNSYMHDVHKEIRVLKKILKEEKIKALGNEKIKKLQKELNWYINECLRLDKICQNLKKEAEKWKRNSTLMKDHMLFLEQRLTAALDKILKNETLKQAQTKQISEVQKDKDINTNKDANKDTYKDTNKHKTPTKINNSKYPLKGKREDYSDKHAQEQEQEIEEAQAEETKKGDNKELHLKIKILEKKLKTQTYVNSNLQKKLAKEYLEKSRYENLFVECVQQIKNEINKKKSNMEKEKYIEENFSPLLEESDIQDFRKDDKKKLIKLFFSSSEMIQIVTKIIFNRENKLTNQNLNLNQKLNLDINRINIPKKGKFASFVL